MIKITKFQYVVLLIFIMSLTNLSASTNFVQKEENLFERGIILFEAGEVKAAVSIFDELSESNYSPALFYLGKIYYHGDGLAKNSSVAFNYFEKAGSNGHKPSLFMLALFFLDNCFDFESCEDADKYFEEASKL